MATGRVPSLPLATSDEAKFLANSSPYAMPGLKKGTPGIDFPQEEPAMIITKSRSGEIEPWKFGLALLGLAVVWFILPRGSQWPLALLLIGGGLAAANSIAKDQGIPTPLQSIGL